MIRALVHVTIGTQRIAYVAIGTSTADMIINAIDRFGVCKVTASPL
jgi:hypothetical protein